MRPCTLLMVRATGGLKDTIFDWEDGRVPSEKRNGFTFSLPSKESLHGALERAFQVFTKEPATWQFLMRRGMMTDYSWKKPAHEYLRLYRQLCATKPLTRKETTVIK
jgi:starch synthase